MGVVSQIQALSIHDGDGIRTTVFLSGCPLRCRWCSNPETWRCQPVIASHGTRCTDCGRCLAVCPVDDALDPAAPHGVRMDQCSLCGGCVDVCPSAAKSWMGSEMTVSEVVEAVMRSNIFFQTSGGGVTFSGGEATFQTAFFNDLVAAFYDLGIHLALETCGHFEWDAVVESLTRMDLIFFDLKVMDGDRHWALTGVDNGRLLENFRRLSTLGVQVVVRMPVVPGLNADEASVAAVAQFVSEVFPRASMELLPYHGYGRYKYDALGITEEAGDFPVPDAGLMARLKAVVESWGVDLWE